MKVYVVPVIYTISGHILVAADSAEEAFKKADAKNISTMEIEDPDHACEVLEDEIELYSPDDE